MRIMKWIPEGKTGRGRPRLRWIDGILEDVKVLGVENCWALAKVCLLYTSQVGPTLIGSSDFPSVSGFYENVLFQK